MGAIQGVGEIRGTARHDDASFGDDSASGDQSSTTASDRPENTSSTESTESTESTVPGLIDALVAADRMVNTVMAFRTELIEAVRVASLLPDDNGALDAGRRVIAPSEDQLAARAAMISEMACALRVPEGTMDSLVDQAQVLLTDLPTTAAAMREGAVSYRHVQVMIEQLEGLDGEARARIEDRLVPRAKVLSVARFKNQARRERERLDPVPVGVRHERAAAGRRVHLEHADDGVSWIHALLPSTVATAAFNRISAVAASLKDPDDGRTLPQLRADVLSAILIDDDAREALRTFHAAASGTGPASGARSTTSGARTSECGCFPDSDRDPTEFSPAGSESNAVDRSKAGSGDSAPEAARRTEQLRQALRRIRATVAVTVPVLTLLGGDAPGELEGYGPIDADVARELCAGAPSFMRLLTHPHTGAVMGVDRDRYVPPADLRAALRLRDQNCRFRGALDPHSAATWTTSLIGPRAARPTRPTSSTCADATTDSDTPPAGKLKSSHTSSTRRNSPVRTTNRLGPACVGPRPRVGRTQPATATAIDTNPTHPPTHQPTRHPTRHPTRCQARHLTRPCPPQPNPTGSGIRTCRWPGTLLEPSPAEVASTTSALPMSPFDHQRRFPTPRAPHHRAAPSPTSRRTDTRRQGRRQGQLHATGGGMPPAEACHRRSDNPDSYMTRTARSPQGRATTTPTVALHRRPGSDRKSNV